MGSVLLLVGCTSSGGNRPPPPDAAADAFSEASHADAKADARFDALDGARDAPGALPRDGPSESTPPPPEATAEAGVPDGPAQRATLSGHLRLGKLLFVDGDTADPLQPLRPNDSIAAAQSIASPSLVGGYLGTVRGSVDDTDVYAVALAPNESVVLHIASPTSGDPFPDFDLALFDDAGNLLDESIGVGPVESVLSTASGLHYALVSAPYREAGLYTLSVGSAISAQAARAHAASKLSSGWPLVPGEALVKLEPGATAAASRWEDLGLSPATAGYNAIGYVRATLAARGTAMNRVGTAAHDRTSTLAAIKRLRRSPGVQWAEPNYVRTIHAAPPNDPLFPVQWHYPMISLLDAWDHTRGAGAIVAVLDTGVKKTHPDFMNADATSQLLSGYDMISDRFAAADGTGRDADADDPGDGELLDGSSWHGSHVAGTIAAATDNAAGCGGVAPAAKILPVRVLGVGGGTVDDIVQGMLYAAGLSNDAGVLPARRADVINMSLGGPGLSRFTADAVALVRAAGTLVVASAGNDGADAAFYSPAAEPGVITVGAVDARNELAWYSNFGPAIDLMGPGGDESTDANGDGLPDGVLSLVYANGGGVLYTGYEGTSMASPHVAGVLALMRAVAPALTPAEVDDLIAGRSTFGTITKDLGAVGEDDVFGNGLVNANLAVLAALDAAQNPAAPAPALLVSASTLDFGTAEDTLPLEVANAGRGTLAVTGFVADAPWITITPGNLGINAITVDRAGLGDGVYTALVTVTSNGGTATVDVRMIVSSTAVAAGGNVGPVYVILVDKTTNTTVAQARAIAADGYAFSLPGIPRGDYSVMAGTDLDDSGFLSDDGEAFGAFPVTSSPKTLHLTADVAALEFPVRFLFSMEPTGPTTVNAAAAAAGTSTAERIRP